jgi:hypothetical protein
MSNQYYDQLLNANFASDYKTPDWYKSSGLAIDSSPERMQAFFDANPQYAKDWQNITSGGTSAFSTDGTSLIKTNFDSMSPQAAQHYAQNPYELLAAEGFGHDPTLQYQAYYGGGSGIPNPRNTNMSSWMQQNRWTPGGIQGGVNNSAALANTAFGAGYDSYRAAAGLGDSTNTQNVANNKQPYLMGGGSPGGSAGGGGGSYGGGTTGGSASSSGGSMSFNPTMNPYLQQMGDMMAGTMTNNWQRKVQPQIASQAVAAGGYGGSRQGVAEANSANDLNMGIGSALANLYGQGYGQGLNYDLGQQNLGLGYANLDRNINNDNLNWRMQGANFGLNLYDRMQQANQLGLQTGTQLQNTPLNYWNQFSQGANSLGQGYGTSTGSQNMPGNPLMGAIGGAQLGSQFANWWGSGNGGASNNNFWSPGFNGSMGD